MIMESEKPFSKLLFAFDLHACRITDLQVLGHSYGSGGVKHFNVISKHVRSFAGVMQLSIIWSIGNFTLCYVQNKENDPFVDFDLI